MKRFPKDYPKDPIKFIEYLDTVLDKESNQPLVREIVTTLIQKNNIGLLLNVMNKLSGARFHLFLNEIPFGVDNRVLKSLLHINEMQTGKLNPEYTNCNKTLVYVKGFPNVEEEKILEYLNLKQTKVLLRHEKNGISARIFVKAQKGFLTEDPELIAKKFDGQAFEGNILEASSCVLPANSRDIKKRKFFPGLILRSDESLLKELYARIKKKHITLPLKNELKVRFFKEQKKVEFMRDFEADLENPQITVTITEFDQCFHTREIREVDPSPVAEEKVDKPKKVVKKNAKDKPKSKKEEIKPDVIPEESKPAEKIAAPQRKMLKLLIETSDYSLDNITKSALGYAGRKCKVDVVKIDDTHYSIEFEKEKKGLVYYKELKDGEYFDSIEIIPE